MERVLWKGKCVFELGGADRELCVWGVVRRGAGRWCNFSRTGGKWIWVFGFIMFDGGNVFGYGYFLVWFRMPNYTKLVDLKK